MVNVYPETKSELHRLRYECVLVIAGHSLCISSVSGRVDMCTVARHFSEDTGYMAAHLQEKNI